MWLSMVHGEDFEKRFYQTSNSAPLYFSILEASARMRNNVAAKLSFRQNVHVTINETRAQCEIGYVRHLCGTCVRVLQTFHRFVKGRPIDEKTVETLVVF